MTTMTPLDDDNPDLQPEGKRDHLKDSKTRVTVISEAGSGTNVKGWKTGQSQAKSLSLLQRLARGLLTAPKPPSVDACYPKSTANLDKVESQTTITDDDIEYLKEVQEQETCLDQLDTASASSASFERPSSWPEVSVPLDRRRSVRSLPQTSSSSSSSSSGMCFPLLTLTKGGTDVQNAAFEELLDQFCKVNGMKGRYHLIRTVLHETRKDPDIAEKLSEIGSRRRRPRHRHYNPTQRDGLTMAEWILKERQRLTQETRLEDIEDEQDTPVNEGELLVEACKYLGLQDPRDTPSTPSSPSSITSRCTNARTDSGIGGTPKQRASSGTSEMRGTLHGTNVNTDDTTRYVKFKENTTTTVGNGKEKVTNCDNNVMNGANTEGHKENSHSKATINCVISMPLRDT